MSEVHIYALNFIQAADPKTIFVESKTTFTFKLDGFVYENTILHRFDVEGGKVSRWDEFMNAVRRE